MTVFSKWVLLVALGFGIAHAQTPPDYCHGVANIYHCGLPDERVPVPLSVSMPTSMPTISAPHPPIILYDSSGLFSGAGTGTVTSIPRVTTTGDVAWTTSGVQHGDESQLRALGTRVNIGSAYFGGGCLPGQKYFYEFQVHEKVFEETWTCGKDRTLGMPTRKLTHIVTQKGQAGYSWEIRK